MSIIETIRTALYGSPPSQAYQPSKEGVIDAFDQLVQSITVISGGVIGSTATIRSSKALLLGVSATDGTLGLVYNDPNTELNGVYYRLGGAWMFTGLLGVGPEGPGPTSETITAATAVAVGAADAAEISEANAAASASLVESVSGPNYANTAAGLAATAEGGSFGVDNGDGTVSIYREVSGAAVFQRRLATTAALADPAGPELLGFSHSETYSPGTLGDHLKRNIEATDEPYGAVDDGTTNNDTPFKDARDAARLTNLPLNISGDTFAFGTVLEAGLATDKVIANAVLKYTGTGNAAVFLDGGASGEGTFGARFSARAIETNASTNYGVSARSLQRANVDFECTAADIGALQVRFSVLSTYRVVCSSNRQPFVVQPDHGIVISARDGGNPLTSAAACQFLPIIEGVASTGIVNNDGSYNIFFGGTSEGNGGGGYASGTDARNNIVFGLFCEANGANDFYIGGYGEALLYCAAGSTTGTVIDGDRAVLQGGLFKKLTISASATGTVLRDVAFIDKENGGGYTDSGTDTIQDNLRVETGTGVISLPDKRRRPKIKAVGGIAITGATKATIAQITIVGHNLDWGDTIAISGMAGMTEFNGGSYQVEIVDANTVRPISGGNYVNSTGFGTYTSGGTAAIAAFANSWANYGGSDRAAGFWRNAEGMVHLVGTIKDGSMGAAAFTLPVGYRPSGRLLFPSINLASPSLSYISVSAAGVVTVENVGTNAFIALSGVSFLAEL